MNINLVNSLFTILSGVVIFFVMYLVIQKYSAKRFYTSTKNDINLLKSKIHEAKTTSSKENKKAI